MEVNNILKNLGSKAPGVKNKIYVAPYAWLDVIAEPDVTEDGTGSLITITDSHTFTDPDLGFITFELADRTGEVTIEEVGEPENEAVNVAFMGYHPGLNRLLLSYFGTSFEGLVLMQDLSCAANTYYQAGASCALARKEGWKFGTGKAGGEGRKGFELKFASYQALPLIYNGALSLATQPALS